MAVRTLEELNQRFGRQILPLLQEFFYEDWSGIAKVLRVANDVTPFISKAAIQVSNVFGAASMQDLEFVDNRDRYVLARVITGDMYQGLYRGRETAFQQRLDAA
jgi:5-methylcytosine-specific restriction protein B